MTYITPDDVQMAQEVKRFNTYKKLTAGWMPSDTYVPALQAAPAVPVQTIQQRTLPTRPRTQSPFNTDAKDMGPGGFIPLA
jgi:hypothetical protein